MGARWLSDSPTNITSQKEVGESDLLTPTSDPWDQVLNIALVGKKNGNEATSKFFSVKVVVPWVDHPVHPKTSSGKINFC